jgi:putative transcriptional regulator
MKNKLKIERAILNITQEELAQKIGFSPNDKLIEKNRFVPSTILALKLSKLFEKPVNFFELEGTINKVFKIFRLI